MATLLPTSIDLCQLPPHSKFRSLKSHMVTHSTHGYTAQWERISKTAKTFILPDISNRLILSGMCFLYNKLLKWDICSQDCNRTTCYFNYLNFRGIGISCLVLDSYQSSVTAFVLKDKKKKTKNKKSPCTPCN